MEGGESGNQSPVVVVFHPFASGFCDTGGCANESRDRAAAEHQKDFRANQSDVTADEGGERKFRGNGLTGFVFPDHGQHGFFHNFVFVF